MDRATYRHVILTLTLVTLVPVGLAEPGDRSARELLTEAAAALQEVQAIEYAFEYGHAEDPTGWVTGRTRMRRVTDASDSWLRVEGTMHAQPRFGVEETRFAYATDGRRAYALDHSARTFQAAEVGKGGNSLSMLAVYGFITEFVEPRPLWKELEHAVSVSRLPAEEVHGVHCDVVQVVFAAGGDETELTWWLGAEDRLPRRGRWLTRGSGSPPLVMEFRDLATGQSWTAADFALAPPDGYEHVPVEVAGGIGRVVPDLELTTADGERVRLRNLERRVVVFDFWNTWCFICRTQTPRIRDLERQLRSPDVRFFGVNIFETGDPLAYWREGGYPYPLLLEGEALAQALDLPYQPAVAVIDGSGTVVFTQLGGSDDRADKVRRAVRSALAAAK